MWDLSTVGNFHCHAGGQDEQADYNLQTANNGWKTLDFNIVPEVVTYLVTTNSANNATKCRYSVKQIHQISFSKCHKELLFTFMKFQMYIAPQTSPEKKTFSDWSRWLKTSETLRCWVAWDFEMPWLQVRQAPLVAVSPGRGLGRLQGRPTWFELPVPSSLRGQNQFPWGRLSRRLRPAQLLIRLPEVLTTLEFELCERGGRGSGGEVDAGQLLQLQVHHGRVRGVQVEGRGGLVGFPQLWENQQRVALVGHEQTTLTVRWRCW